MKRILLFNLLFALLSLCASSQGIKMKITNITPAAGEDVIAFEASDTLATTIAGGGGGASKPIFELVKIKKLRDVSTNTLWKNSINGLHIPQIDFEFYDTSSTMFYKISLLDAQVNHFSFLSPECAGCSKLYHQEWFSYVKIETTDVATGNVVRYNRTTGAFY